MVNDNTNRHVDQSGDIALVQDSPCISIFFNSIIH